MFIEPTITWVPSGFSVYIWLDTKIVLKKSENQTVQPVYSKHELILLDRYYTNISMFVVDLAVWPCAPAE